MSISQPSAVAPFHLVVQMTKSERHNTLSVAGLLLFPTLLVVCLSLLPLGFIALDSLNTGHGERGFDNYVRFTTSIFMRQAGFSIALAAAVATIALVFAVPFTYLLAGMGRRWQALWLIYVLAQLSLSEVLIAFSWQILLSSKTGITNLFVWVGLMSESASIVPSLGAVVISLTYLSIPFAVLVLYPAFSRLDPNLTEAARTMGAGPMRAFFSVVLPMMRRALLTSAITLYVLNLGAIIVPQLLGKPRHWTLAVHISDQAIFQFNTPFASALAIILLGLSVLILALLLRSAGKLERTT